MKLPWPYLALAFAAAVALSSFALAFAAARSMALSSFALAFSSFAAACSAPARSFFACLISLSIAEGAEEEHEGAARVAPADGAEEEHEGAPAEEA